MRTFVLDASVTVAWLLRQSAEADRVLELLAEGPKALVPGLWHLETRNSLIVEMRRKKLSTGWYKRIVGHLGSLPVQTDHQFNLESSFGLAVRHNLTFYDAVYLELAKRCDVPIATFDKAIVKAAKAEKLPLICRKIS